MADVIQLLPDAIANQIAAGEVIQRPASVVKELMENAIDAGASRIKVIVKEAGKTLIQVIDNGCGMSETDARMSFERHATSKIRETHDLFSIKTMGFRGEAMASIAAVAQVEMRTRKHRDELGTRIVIESSEIKKQEPCQCVGGTAILVKNLFFNVPARRKFLKSNSHEMRRILDEFQRIAIANPDIFFSLHHNDSEIFHLPAGNLRQRIVSIFGSSSNKKLVPINQETDIVKIYGFVGKPQFAKRTRSEQMFFVNQRFIKSGYLNHALMGAYEDLIPADNYPLYVVFIDINPASIDINVHPTKQEIKFDDEKLIYDYLKVAIRHALGQYSVTPTLDFSADHSFSAHKMQVNRPNRSQEVDFGGRSSSSSSRGKSGNGMNTSPSQREKNNLKNWQKLYDGLDEMVTPDNVVPAVTIESEWTAATPIDDDEGTFSNQRKVPYQIHNTYIVSQIKSGFLLIDQQLAHERILYERYLALLENQTSPTQKSLFATTVEFSPGDSAILKDILPQIRQLGFDIEEFGGSSFVINGVPADLKQGKNEQKLLEQLLEQFKQNVGLRLNIKENIAQSMARSATVKRGQALNIEEMQELIDKLFACSIPFKSPSGKNAFITFELEELEKQFGNG